MTIHKAVVATMSGAMLQMAQLLACEVDARSKAHQKGRGGGSSGEHLLCKYKDLNSSPSTHMKKCVCKSNFFFLRWRNEMRAVLKMC